MLVERVCLYSFYAALAVFDPVGPVHGIRPRPQHLAQGFAWRLGYVLFCLLDDAGELVTSIHRDAVLQPRSDAVRAIVVPFTVPPAGQVTISDFVTAGMVGLPPGPSALLFETGPAGEAVAWVRLTFVPDLAVQAAILRADARLAPTAPLLMEADPA